MQRRTFLKNTLTTSVGLMALPAFSQAGAGTFASVPIDGLQTGFLNPPLSARPWVFWQWMNGNITKEGITLDLEAMQQMGLGGALCFNNAVGIPRGPVDYASDQWMDATVHAAIETQRLGLSLMVHNSPGYSGCGGPWVTPEMSMQQLVWTEMRVSSIGKVDVQLPKPYAKQDYYRDAFVIAYPALPVEKGLMKEKLIRVLVNGKEIDTTPITDGNPETKIRLEPPVATHTSGQEGREANGAILTFEFSEPFEARSISLTRKPEVPHDLFDGPRDHPPLFRLESSDDGMTFTLVGSFTTPELREMDTPAAMNFPVVSARYFRLVSATSTWVSGVEVHAGPRLGGWPGKTSFTHGNAAGETALLDKDLIIEPSRVVDLSSKLDSRGRLQWDAPIGVWTILRIGHTTTGEEPAAHPDSGKGLEIDKFRKDALDFHFTKFLEGLITRLKPYSSFKGLTVDSWEAGKQNWTIQFPAEFKQRRGYDLTPWMLALTGRVVGSEAETERFLWDVRRTQADLLSENFYGHFQARCHQNGLEFHAEPYGDGNLDSLQIAQHLDVPMAEFWTRYIYGSDVTSKQAASAAHAYGRPIAAAEAFTGMPFTSKWTDYPYSLKAESDYFFTLGINRLLLHTFVHQPYTTGLPGMTMGPFGTHFDRNSTWTQQATGWLQYLTRAQHLLQQGLAVVDVCSFKGDEPTSGIPDIYGAMPKGYVGDVVGPDALLNRFSIKAGKIVLPDGMSYRLLMLPALKSLSPEVALKLAQFVAEGLVLLVASRPDGAPGFRREETEATRRLIAELWGSLDGHSVQERAYGNGKIIWGKSLDDVLNQHGIGPDFTYTAKNQDATIHFIHKKFADGADGYFVTNHRRRTESIVCSFRMTGSQPELWDTETGSVVRAALFEEVNGRTQLSLELEPAGAVFVVFRSKVSVPGIHSIVRNGIEILSTNPYPVATPALYADVQNTFTITVWAKPDTFAHGGRSMLFHAPQGQDIYGDGHVACGVSAGQNAVRLYERARGPAREVLVSNQPLEGWTHLAIVYQNGTPSLYINGKVAAQGKSRTQSVIVHPGLGTPASQEQFSSYFEGNCTALHLYKEALAAERISQLVAAGLPAPAMPSAIQLTQQVDGKLKALIWQDGTYSIRQSGGQKAIDLTIKNSCRVVSINGPWSVQFPNGLGAPSKIELPNLMSLHKHPEFGVKHFSGTATYHKVITINPIELAANKRLYLDLGRVEVIASVKLNGQYVGLLWKEPFRADITKVAKTGANSLEIQVTNLWPNRLIGDEHLPVENQYSKDRFILKLPEWYRQNGPKPGQRVTFSVWHNIEKTGPLLESGLLGPVRLLTVVEKIV